MKTHIIILVAAMFAVGCSHKPDARDAKIAKLETRLSEVESRCDKLTDSFTNTLALIQQLNKEDMDSLSKVEALVLKDRDDWDALMPMLAALTNPPPKQVAMPRYVPAQPQVSAYATRDGVPIGIYNQIAADAAREWPGDYDMQAYTIKNQVEAFKKLHQ